MSGSSKQAKISPNLMILKKENEATGDMKCTKCSIVKIEIKLRDKLKICALIAA